jgi:hypothetical protein
LTWYTKKDEPFEWESEYQLAFETMLTTFTQAPALRCFVHEKEVIDQTDFLDYVSTRVLSQRDDEGMLDPVLYTSKSHSLAECNYDTFNKELMVNINALEELRPECEGATYPLPLITHHKNLESFITKNLVNRRQA